MNIVDVIANLDALRHLSPATQQEIIIAENALGVAFDEEYKAFVGNYGAISARGIELMGITEHPRLSVVEVTKKERELNDNFPFDMYVVENPGIDGIIILQSSSGEIFAFYPDSRLEKLCDSLSEYILQVNSES